jgi:hypothetical protein
MGIADATPLIVTKIDNKPKTIDTPYLMIFGNKNLIMVIINA